MTRLGHRFVLESVDRLRLLPFDADEENEKRRDHKRRWDRQSGVVVRGGYVLTAHRSLGAWLFALVASLLCAEAALAKRVALVVGISNYAHSPKLANPGRDAAGMATALQTAGFEVVESLDQGLPGVLQALEDFYARADGAETALFFFAGHGLQFDGVNYLVPKDAQLRSESRVKQETVALQDIISAIEKRAAITLVFLDACRDNPLAEELLRSTKGASRSAAVPRGLAPMTIRNPDTLLVFAAAPGKTASDGSGRHSPFTSALLQNISNPGIEIELLMKRVTRDVVQATNGAQVPERLSRLTTEFVFNTAKDGPTLKAPPATPPSTTVSATKPTLSPAAPAVRPDVRVASVPRMEKRGGSNCVILGQLSDPLAVRSGMRICADAGNDHAMIKRVTTSAVVYAVNGGFEISCNTKELCQFDWPGAPMFNVRIVPAADGSGAAQAELVARSR